MVSDSKNITLFVCCWWCQRVLMFFPNKIQITFLNKTVYQECSTMSPQRQFKNNFFFGSVFSLCFEETLDEIPVGNSNLSRPLKLFYELFLCVPYGHLMEKAETNISLELVC